MRLLFTLICFSPFVLMAQFPEDALRYGYPVMNGTARNMAIGGAMGSLGGDLTAAHINPAGIGLYKNAEIVLSPAFQFGKYAYTYQNDKTTSNKNNFLYGTTGFVTGSSNAAYRKATSSAFSISVNQIANYNNSIKYQGANSQSSWSEQYLEELIRDNVQTFDKLENGYPLGSSLAFWTFLVDTIANGDNIGGYQSLVPVSSNNPIQQTNQIDTKGGAHEIALAFANNYSDKFYLGGSINFPIYSFKKEQVYKEEDLSNNTDNDFSYFEYKSSSETSGFGINAKLGVIFKPVEKLRLGLAFHSPTVAGMTDSYSASMATNTEKYTTGFPQPQTKSSSELTGVDKIEYEYNLTTPYRLIGSFSYVVNEVRDVKKQRGFITADVEYVNHRGVRYKEVNPEDAGYYDALNEVIKDRYKNAINFKVGGELKFEKIMARLGFASYGNPYSDATGLKANRTLLSGGLGYRHHGVFIDLTYVHSFIGDSHIPYYLTDKPNMVADAKNSKGGLVMTVGFKL